MCLSVLAFNFTVWALAQSDRLRNRAFPLRCPHRSVICKGQKVCMKLTRSCICYSGVSAALKLSPFYISAYAFDSPSDHMKLLDDQVKPISCSASLDMTCSDACIGNVSRFVPTTRSENFVELAGKMPIQFAGGLSQRKLASYCPRSLVQRKNRRKIAS